MKALFVREYTYVEALQNISFTIGEGEIVGYIGPNGAGKSTTIKIMSGILVPDRGTCSIMGCTPWKGRAAYVKNIGVVFGQRSQLWWDVPVIDSFELLKDIYKILQSTYKSNLDLLVEILELNSLIHTPVRQLSLGQRMRCEIAASLLHDPKVLFLDEPTIGLDAVSKIAVRHFIKTINREKGVTVILTTHDMHDIEALANRILLIGNGRLLYQGSLAQLRNRFGAYRTITADYREFQRAPGQTRLPEQAHPSEQVSSPEPSLFAGHPLTFDIPGVKLVSRSAERAVLSVDTERVTISDVITRLASGVELIDVAIEARPIEEVIVQLYKEFSILELISPLASCVLSSACNTGQRQWRAY